MNVRLQLFHRLYASQVSKKILDLASGKMATGTMKPIEDRLSFQICRRNSRSVLTPTSIILSVNRSSIGIVRRL